MLDVVGDHDGLTDGFNDKVGLLEGFTDNDGRVEGFDESDGMDDEDGSLDGVELGTELGKSPSFEQMRNTEIRVVEHSEFEL
jgi:hypothetical protein